MLTKNPKQQQQRKAMILILKMNKNKGNGYALLPSMPSIWEMTMLLPACQCVGWSSGKVQVCSSDSLLRSNASFQRCLAPWLWGGGEADHVRVCRRPGASSPWGPSLPAPAFLENALYGNHNTNVTSGCETGSLCVAGGSLKKCGNYKEQAVNVWSTLTF